MQLATASDPRVGERAFPILRFPQGIDLAYTGMFSADAVFRPPFKFAMAAGYVNGEGIPPANGGAAASDAPPWMLLSNERVVENLEPPVHSRGTFSAPLANGCVPQSSDHMDLWSAQRDPARLSTS